MSEVVTHGLRQYVKHARDGADTGHPVSTTSATDPAAGPAVDAAVAGAVGPAVGPAVGVPAVPEGLAARLRELRSSGRSQLLSATLAALAEAGWPLRSLAEALGVSRQAVQARVRRRVPAELREHVVSCEPPPPFPQRRVASAAGLRPHLTIKIDHALRAAAHRAAAHEGRSLSLVVEAILDRYLRHGMPDGDQPVRAVSRPDRRSR